MAVNPIASTSSSTSAATSTKNDAGSEDRFLKLLVTQMQNQDPLNPMDNAQVTSQMAQINTVSGIEKLNKTVAALGTQFGSLQTLQSVALVGHDVTVPGNKVSYDDKGTGSGGFELDGPADAVKVEVLNASGRVIDTLNLGAMGSGVQAFDWTPASAAAADANATFRVTATKGTAAVTNTALMTDRVDAVSTSGDKLMVELARGGKVDWTSIRAFN